MSTTLLNLCMFHTVLGNALTCQKCMYNSTLPQVQQKCNQSVTMNCNSSTKCYTIVTQQSIRMRTVRFTWAEIVTSRKLSVQMLRKHAVPWPNRITWKPALLLVVRRIIATIIILPALRLAWWPSLLLSWWWLLVLSLDNFFNLCLVWSTFLLL